MFDEEFGKGNAKTVNLLDAIALHGVPKDMESVDSLIHKKDDRVRKEVEKWAVLTYSDNRAIINEKKGGDGGIDGLAYIRTTKDEVAPVVFSVKTNQAAVADHIRDLFAVVESEKAACGFLLTRYKPTPGMKAFAKKQGKFKPEMFPAFDKLQIITIQEILDGEKMNLPLMEEVTKKAQKASADDQPSLLDDESV